MTLVNYAVYWLLPLAAILRGQAGYGAAILGLFGLGRAVVTLATSLAFRADQGFGPHDLLGLQAHGAVVRRVHVAGAAALLAVIGAFAVIAD